MTRNTLFLAGAALCALILAGCSNPNDPDPDTNPGSGGGTTTYYSVSGSITLSGGAGAVTGVTVELIQGGETKKTTNPVSGGGYSFTDVAAGNGYTVKASLTGYTTSETASFNVSANVSGKDLELAVLGNNTTPCSLWGSSARFTKVDNTTATLDIDWTGSTSGDLSEITGTVVTDFVNGKNITVTFAKTGDDTGSDRISFGKIAELKAALTGAGAASVTMKSSSNPEKAVAPLFNGDDLFDTHTSIGTNKVFSQYADNDNIFDGFVVKNTGTGWYIYNVGNKPIYVSRLKFKGGNNNFLDGFGLKSAFGNITFDDAVALTGYDNPSATSTTAAITPEHLRSALSNLGINTAAQIPLFDITGLILRANYISGSDKNLQDYPIILGLLDKYMPQSGTDNRAKLNGLTITASGFGSLYLQKSIPFDGNGIIDPFNEADKVNGNLAVWLGNKGVALQEVYLTNPNLYNSDTSIGSLRNVVLDGHDWKAIDIGYASGVIVSKNTPVKSIDDVGNSNLWYVVQAQSSNHTVVANVSVLELGSLVSDASKISAPGPSHNLAALITSDSTQRGAVDSRFHPAAGKDYIGTSPITTTWSSYASGVIGGVPPEITRAPSLKAGSLEAYGEWLRNGPELLAAALRDKSIFADISKVIVREAFLNDRKYRGSAGGARHQFCVVSGEPGYATYSAGVRPHNGCARCPDARFTFNSSHFFHSCLFVSIRG